MKTYENPWFLEGFWRVFSDASKSPIVFVSFVSAAAGRLLLQELARWETLAEEPRDAWCHGVERGLVGSIWKNEIWC